MENINIEGMPLSETKGESLDTTSEPMALSAAVVQSLASALTKIETYVPTVWADNTEPDIDAEHLNHAEQAIMRVTNLMNGAVDVIQDLQAQLNDVNSNFEVLNSSALTQIYTGCSYGTLDDFRNGVHILYGNLLQGRGHGVILEYQYQSANMYYGAQLFLGYADPIKFRQRNESIWSEWVSK